MKRWSIFWVIWWDLRSRSSWVLRHCLCDTRQAMLHQSALQISWRQRLYCSQWRSKAWRAQNVGLSSSSGGQSAANLTPLNCRLSFNLYCCCLSWVIWYIYSSPDSKYASDHSSQSPIQLYTFTVLTSYTFSAYLSSTGGTALPCPWDSSVIQATAVLSTI